MTGGGGERAGKWGRKPVSRRRDDALARIDPLEFEALVARYYRLQGYAVEHTGTGGTGHGFDGGIDLELRRDGECLLVQCKRENAFQVTHNPVHQLIGNVATEHATGAIFVNTGEYTPHARKVAAEVAWLRLIDGDQARAMLDPLLESGAGSATVSRSGETWERMDDARRRGTRRPASPRRPIPGAGTWTAWLPGAVFLVVLVRCGPGFVSRHPATSPTHAARPRPASSPADDPAPIARPAAVPMPPVQSSPFPATRHELSAPMSDAQLREWQRKNAESMAILEKTTPEL